MTEWIWVAVLAFFAVLIWVAINYATKVEEPKAVKKRKDVPRERGDEPKWPVKMPAKKDVPRKRGDGPKGGKDGRNVTRR